MDSACARCIRLEQDNDKLRADIDLMEGRIRLLEIAEEYAELLAEQGRIPNTPAGKRGYIDGSIVAS